MDRIVKDYNKCFSILITMLYNKRKREMEVEKIKTRFDTIKHNTPDQIIQHTGPYIWKYREQIAQDNIAFFLENDFNTELAKEDDENVKRAKELINIIKKLWAESNEKERNIVKINVKSLLKEYANYLSACKN